VNPSPNLAEGDLLRRLPLFSRLGEDALERVRRRVVVRSVPRRTLLFREGEPCRGLFVVVRGRVRVYRANREGREQLIHDMGPGRAVAEVPLFDGGPYPADARAEEDSDLLFLSREDFQALYRAEPEIADAVILELGRRLRRAVGLIEKISLRDVPSRVGLTLLEYAGGGGPKGAGPTTGRDPRSHPFTLPCTQAEMAERLAATRESVARALRTLREEGLIRQEGRRIEIPDPSALESRCRGM